MIYIDDLIGIPYKKDGKDKKGFDCKGLVVFLLNRIGHKVNDLNINAGMIKTDTPKEGDVLLFYDSNGRVFHTGMYLKNDYFIHCDNRGVNVTKINKCCNYWEAFTWQR